MLHITAIPAFKDNYFWLLTEQPLASGTPQPAYIIDPGDGEAVHNVLTQHSLSLAGILITHRHPDHTGGIRFLTERYQTPPSNGVPVYGPDSEAIPQITEYVYESDIVTLFDRYTLEVLETPGHTPEHIVYFSRNIQTAPVLFCGDTLFAAGCGRLLGGTAQQLYQSLQRLATLPDNTQVYCAHEYTLANLDFAQTVEPENMTIHQRLVNATATRANDQATIPFMLSEERNTNPFLRVHTDAVRHAVNTYWKIPTPATQTPADIFAKLRRWKDNY